MSDVDVKKPRAKIVRPDGTSPSPKEPSTASPSPANKSPGLKTQAEPMEIPEFAMDGTPLSQEQKDSLIAFQALR